MRQRTPFKRISVPEARSLLARKAVLVLDVRDTPAFSRAHIKGAQNVSIGNLSEIINTTARSTPILICCYHGYASQEYGQVLAGFGYSDVYSLDGGFAAWEQAERAARGPEPGVVLRRWLAAHGFPANDVNATIANNTTPLMKASQRGQAKVVRALIGAGSQINARNADGNNALWLGCVSGNLDVIDILIDAGIDINNCNDNGATALVYAASAGKAAAVERLLQAGADLAPETPDGFTALDMAATIECLTVLRNASRSRMERRPPASPETTRAIV